MEDFYAVAGLKSWVLNVTGLDLFEVELCSGQAAIGTSAGKFGHFVTS